jgi:hypothetical protein
MDALKGIGHACGHNLIGISGEHLSCILRTFDAHIITGVAVACAIKAALEAHNISGKVVLLGTPGKRTPLLNASRVLTNCSISRRRWIWKGSSLGKGCL